MKRASSRALKTIVADGGVEMGLIVSESKRATHKNLDRLLRPRSIALIGASATSGSLGEAVLLNLEENGYSGELHLVNPKRPIIHGRACFGSIDELPSNIDCAVLAIPGSAVLASARACANKKVGSIIVFSAGFAEGGEDGRAAQRELESIARDHDLILEGPNCLGMVNYADGIPLTFVVTPPQKATDEPGAAIISQSGALAAVIAVNMRHHRIPLTYSVSTGNEASTFVEDFVEHLIGDKKTRVLAMVVEQFRQPKRFLELARRAREAGQFIVLLHPGRSNAARASAATHTGAIAGDYQVMHTLVTHAGVTHVESMEELVDVSQILVRCCHLPQGGAAVFTESGAFKAHALDLCEQIGLELPALSPTTERALREVLPEFILPSNPLDLTAQGLVDPGLYRRTLPPVLDDVRFGSVVLGIILTDSKTIGLKLPPILDAMRTLKPQKPVVFAALDEGAPFDFAGIDELRDLGVACFPSPERAIRALAHVTLLGARKALCGDEVASRPASLDASYELLTEHKSKEILAELGVPVPAGQPARSVEAAIRTAQEIGFPVVLKAQAADLPHKTEAGGVLLGLDSAETIAEGWHALHRNVQAHRPGLVLDCVLVERMAEKGVELIVGARNDPQWGPVLLVGFGGVLAEAIQDVRILPADLSQMAIQEELNKLRCGALLRGFRGAPALDVEAAAEVVSRIGRLMRAAPEIREIDINPLVVYPKGAGVVALDGLIAVDSSGQSRTERDGGGRDE
jgi:acetate---CoA ligase (ADP-forming)